MAKFTIEERARLEEARARQRETRARIAALGRRPGATGGTFDRVPGQPDPILDAIGSVVDDIKRTRPNRQCNGGPHGKAWCGKPATVVCTATDGLQWYACDELAHQERAATRPIAEWFAELDAYTRRAPEVR